MPPLQSVLAALAPALLLAAGLLPSRWANRHVAAVRGVTAAATLGALLASLAAAGLLAANGPAHQIFVGSARSVFPLGIFHDGLTAVMMVLISFIGWVIGRFSVRYLDGDAAQGQFLKYLCLTLGAVLTVVVASNLALLTAAWMLASYGLHQLLTHYRQRPEALLAARNKFLVSRLGDVLLLAALGLTWHSFGSFEYSEIFRSAGALLAAGGPLALEVQAIAVLLALGAMTKSAQFPVHSWLPDTLSVPTPVSALMHAGIINAGGFLVIRLSPLVSLSPAALDLLVLAGGFTALFGAVVMLTQSSIKRALAYSTVAQMGFMMLQCGLGAFACALLHIVAHSLYKAYAFLNSGNSLNEPVSAQVPNNSQSVASAVPALLAAFFCALAIKFGAAALLPVALPNTAAQLVLSTVMVLALTQLLWSAFRSGRGGPAGFGLLSAAFLALAYLGALTGTGLLLDRTAPATYVANADVPLVVAGLICAGFVLVFALQAVLHAAPRSAFLKRLYLLARNGFHADIPAQHLVLSLWGTPVAASASANKEN